ncbi:F-box protein CPR1-like isoform X2 [Prosopis cineraria]|nr:F-box protein CPR1-like isoform X2 [Prosopis cineraria]XP_054776893.1 F-box protein CPR1-like isoform X2 [Prosopis cineraria]
MRMATDGDLPFLPQEITRNILKRVPVRSLIRFQCVCKDWKNLIRTPSFIEEHLQHSNHHNPSLLFQLNAIGDPLLLYSLDRDMQVLEIQNHPLTHSMLSDRIVGSSNGLLCLQRSGSEFLLLLLWNPAIREIRQVPSDVYDFKGNIRIGFGYSPIVSDYKILTAYAPHLRDINRVDVYSLSSGQWREVESGNLEGINLYSETVTANGAMFWIASQRGAEDDIELIVSFDIAMEVFTLIPMPALDSALYYNLAVYENNLALLSYTKTRNSQSYLIDLWVMDDGIGAPQERWSWNKKYSITTFSSLLNPSCIWRNDTVCFVDQVHGSEWGMRNVLSLLNLETNKVRLITTRRFGDRFPVIFNHAESLVPIGGIHIEEP